MNDSQSKAEPTWMWVVLNEADTADAVFTSEEAACRYAKARWACIVHGPVELDPRPEVGGATQEASPG